jgi:hypothetical protein
MKNANDTIGNLIRDLPACSAVPQRTVPASVTKNTGITINENIKYVIFVSDARGKRTILDYDIDFRSLTSFLDKTPVDPAGQ